MLKCDEKIDPTKQSSGRLAAAADFVVRHEDDEVNVDRKLI